MNLSDEQLEVLRSAPHMLHSLTNVGDGVGHHIWTLYRAGYLEQTAREPTDLTMWVTTYDLTDLGRWTVKANKNRPQYVDLAPIMGTIQRRFDRCCHGRGG